MLRPAHTLAIGHHYWIDQLNPWVLRFGDGFGIRWYGLAYLAGFLLAGWILLRWARKGRLPNPPEEVLNFILCRIHMGLSEWIAPELMVPIGSLGIGHLGHL